MKSVTCGVAVVACDWLPDAQSHQAIKETTKFMFCDEYSSFLYGYMWTKRMTLLVCAYM